MFVLRTGAQWNALNATGICSSKPAHRRFQDWVQAGLFEEFWQLGLLNLQALNQIDWTWLALDGAMTKAPLGGKKTGPSPTDRGKGSVKRSVLTEAHGIPLAVVVDGARRPDMTLVEAMLTDLMMPRPLPTPHKPQGLCLDKGYDYEAVRELGSVDHPFQGLQTTRPA